MRTVGLDFEAYYDTDFSLKKVTNLEYIRDPKFEVLGCSIWDRSSMDEPQWYPLPAFEEWAANEDLSDAVLVCHNYPFDGGVLHDRYGLAPGRRVDTIGLGRALLPRDTPLDLDSMGRLLGLGQKKDDSQALAAVKGYYYQDLTGEMAHLLDDLGGYANEDVALMMRIYDLLSPHLPEPEWDYMDITLRIAVEGSLYFDRERATNLLSEIESRRAQLLDEAGFDGATARSKDKFVAVLSSLYGIDDIPTKVTDKGNTVYALAKDDPGYTRMKADYPHAAPAFAAREACTSNNTATRLKRLTHISGMAPYTIPMQVNYGGAHTGRITGAGGINMLNLDRKSGLRECLYAPEGFCMRVDDLSGIEMRMNFWFSGEETGLRELRAGGDPYISQAAQQLNIPPDQVTDEQRQFGKVIELGAGFQMGGPRFRDYCAGGPLGMDPIYLSEEEAYLAIQNYRALRAMVAMSWKRLQQQVIPLMVTLPEGEVNDTLIPPVEIRRERLILPGGWQLSYPNLSFDEDGITFGLKYRRHLHGGILQENIVQSLSRQLLYQYMVEIDRELAQEFGTENGRVVHQVYDEVVDLIPDNEPARQKAAEIKKRIMTQPPSWAPDLPLKVEGDWGYRYTK